MSKSKRRNAEPTELIFVRITEVGVWAVDLTDEELEDLRKRVLNSQWHKQNLRQGIWDQVKRDDLDRDELIDLIGRIYRAEDKTELDREDAYQAELQAAAEAAEQAKRDQLLAAAMQQYDKSCAHARGVLAIEGLVLPEIIRQELEEAAQAEFSNQAVERLSLVLATAKPIVARYREHQAAERAAAEQAAAEQAHCDAKSSLENQLSRLTSLKEGLNGMGQHFDSVEKAAHTKLSDADRLSTSELTRTASMLEALLDEFEPA
jgi:hypothetical protein